MSDQSWRSIFVGREDELKLLHDAWAKAKDGNPQFITFLAETGVGKTRLIQHFYSELTKKEDPDHYWPDSMDSAASSLAINPEFPETKEQGKIPWLWWGVRASDPAGRNQAENFGCAVQDAQCKIEAHAISIIFNRQKKTLTKDMYIEMIKLGCDSFADWVTLGVMSKLYDASQLMLKYKEERKRQKQEQLTIHQITEQKKADLSDTAFDYVRTILDKKDKDAPTVPVILILDDAQWFDPTSLRFVELLWQAASKNGWPLLIVATHWVREWRQYEMKLNDEKMSTISFDQQPINLAHMIQRNPRLFDRWEPVELPTIDSNLLHAVLMEAFSGLTKKQQQIILGHVGGNPQYLDDLIRWIENNPRKFFGTKDCTMPLTDGGEKHIDNLLKSGHMALVRDRFEALEEDMRDLLGFGSYQGMSFIEPLVVEVVNRLYNEDDTDWQGHFGHAMHPYAVISRISEATDEFTQRNVYQIAKEHLHDGGDKKTEFSEILLSVLCEWYESGKITEQSPSEQEALLVLLCREISDLPEYADLQVHAQMKLVELYNESNRVSDAAEIALNMVDEMPKSGWPLKLLSFPLQIQLGNALIEFSHNDLAAQLLTNLLRLMHIESSQDSAWKNDLAAAHMNRGVLFQRQSHASEALADYQAAIDIRQQLRDEMGAQFPPAWKNDLAMCCYNFALFLESSDKEKACSLFSQAFQLATSLHDEFGDDMPSQWMQVLAVSEEACKRCGG